MFICRSNKHHKVFLTTPSEPYSVAVRNTPTHSLHIDMMIMTKIDHQTKWHIKTLNDKDIIQQRIGHQMNARRLRTINIIYKI